MVNQILDELGLNFLSTLSLKQKIALGVSVFGLAFGGVQVINNANFGSLPQDPSQWSSNLSNPDTVRQQQLQRDRDLQDSRYRSPTPTSANPTATHTPIPNNPNVPSWAVRTRVPTPKK